MQIAHRRWFAVFVAIGLVALIWRIAAREPAANGAEPSVAVAPAPAREPAPTLLDSTERVETETPVETKPTPEIEPTPPAATAAPGATPAGSGVLLHVVDAASGVELDDVTIIAQPQQVSISDSINPPQRPTRAMRERPFVEHAVSPVQLPPADYVAPFWVLAAHHAWQKVDIAGTSGERTVRLLAASALLVRLPVNPPGAGALKLTINGADPDSPLVREDLGRSPEREQLFDGLPIGTYSAVLKLSSRGSLERVASKEVLLEPGSTTIWDVQWIGPADLGSLSIVVHAGAELSKGVEANFELTLVDKSGAAKYEKRWLSFEATDGSYRGRAEKLEPALYEVSIHPWNQIARIEVAQGLEASIAFDPARRIPAFVRAVDAVSGAALPDSNVMFANLAAGERAAHLFEANERDPSGAGWRILVEPGLVDVAASATGYVGHRQSYPISEPEQLLTIALSKSANLPITLTLKQGDTLFPISPELWVKIAVDSAPTGGQATRHEFSSRGTAGRMAGSVIRVSAAGVYTLRVPSSIVGGTSDQLVRVDVKDPEGAMVELQRQD